LIGRTRSRYSVDQSDSLASMTWIFWPFFRRKAPIHG
jgi:hypothetical protein